MGFEERENRPEFTAPLDQWVGEIQKRWENVPEFRVDSGKLKHLAIICDGNRRSAQQRGLPSYFGHRAGVEAIKGMARACRKWEVRTLTFWVWSTENWRRDQEQIAFVMSLAEHFLPQKELLQELQEDNVCFRHIGRKDRLPDLVVGALKNLEAETWENKEYNLNLALDYGGLDEMVRTVERFLQETPQAGLFSNNPDYLLEFLDTGGQPKPDLVIRTGMQKGEVFRTSGFMPLQTAYAGWIPLSAPFPDLTPRGLLRAIKKFEDYERRRGV